jgi:repressor LexA
MFNLASGMGMEIDDLLKMMDADQPLELPRPIAVRIPVVGRVRAGIPIETAEEIIGWEEITQKLAAEGEYFALRVNGDSMAPRILDGDIVIVKKQKCCDDGDIAIVLVNGSDATVKQVRKSEQGITLIGFNPTVYAPHFYTAQDVEALPVEIIGKVVELRGKM